MNYTYNPNGSLTNAMKDAFISAAYHKHSCFPIRITGSGASVSLWYDSVGRRAVKKGAVNVSYRRGIDGGIIPLSEIVSGDEVVYIETPSGHRLSRTSMIYYIHSLDHLGSCRLRLSNADCVAAMYSAYGESIISAPLRYTFTGYELDSETILMNAWRRIYSPTLARFVMVDPKFQNASPYLYCNGDPFNNTDPTGEISSAVISGIITALVLILTIVIVVVSEGTAAPEALESEIQLGSVDAQMQADINAADQATTESATYAKTRMPTTRLGMAGTGATMSGAGSFVSNGAGLVTNAAKGEHISAWQGVKAMLIEPAIATVTGFIGGGIAGLGAMAFKGAFVTLGAYALGAAVTSVSSTLLTDAAERRKADGAELGLQVGVAVGEAFLMSLAFTPVHPRAVIRHSVWESESAHLPMQGQPLYPRSSLVTKEDTVRQQLNREGAYSNVVSKTSVKSRRYILRTQKVRLKGQFKAPEEILPMVLPGDAPAASTPADTDAQT